MVGPSFFSKGLQNSTGMHDYHSLGLGPSPLAVLDKLRQTGSAAGGHGAPAGDAGPASGDHFGGFTQSSPVQSTDFDVHGWRYYM